MIDGFQLYDEFNRVILEITATVVPGSSVKNSGTVTAAAPPSNASGALGGTEEILAIALLRKAEELEATGNKLLAELMYLRVIQIAATGVRNREAARFPGVKAYAKALVESGLKVFDLATNQEAAVAA